MENPTPIKETAKNLKDAISAYCRAAVNAGICDEDTCEWCSVNQAYEMAEKHCQESETEEDEEEEQQNG